jgi:hypothetical protein
MKRAFYLFTLFFALLAFSQTARAQEFVYSVSHVEQFGDPSNPSSVMAGYSGTGMTYGIATWYNAIHVSTLERDGVIVDQQVWENFPSVFNATSAPLLAGSTYRQYTDTAVRIVFPYVCGVRYDAFGFSAYAYLSYGDGRQWPPFPAICVAVQIVFLGYTVAEQQASQPNQQCVDTCTPCKRDRRNRIIACSAVAGACETAAFVAYENAINNCNFQPFCNPANPAFNQAQCDNCRNAARNTLIAQTAACGGAATTCFLTLPDCSLKDSCPNGPNGQKGPCN